jgi:GNAT superfamily N-acetyltransferase
MSPQFLPASEVPFEAFLEAFNASYANYYIPIEMEEDGMRRLMKRDAISLTSSLVAVEAGQVIALGMLALRHHHAWIGGLGVIPAHRGRGLGRQITEKLLDQARKFHIREVYLEVMEKNLPAQHLYESLNFQAFRRLLVLHAPYTPRPDPPDHDFRIEDTRPAQALSHYQRFHPRPNPWQRRYESLAELGDMDAWTVYEGGEVVAYAVGWLFWDTIRFMDIAALPGHEAALRVLLEHIHSLAPEAEGGLSNFPETEAAWPILRSLGYQVVEAQHEMVLKLS